MIAAVLVVAGVATGVVVGAGSLVKGGGRAGVEEVRWAEGITPVWMGEHMGLDVPAGARSARAAYKVTSRFDTGLLTFTLSEAEAEAYFEKYPPSARWLTPTAAQPDTPPSDFARFGLPEPETLKDGMRYGYVCPGAAAEPTASPDPFGMGSYDVSDEKCVRAYVHEYAPDRTRLYFRTHFEPGVDSLPTPLSTPSPAR
ncbi:hypothetical protein ACFVP0_09205 [Streptomyces cinereoruber]|uniref:hypothetical protein n=1 Tax=Streptomyces cinereoruber TaxID=67260 RepID=UPI0036D08946